MAKFIAKCAAALTLVSLTAGAPLGRSHSGTLSGTNTVDTIKFTADPGDVIDFRVSASGSGSNKLRVRVEQLFLSGGGWGTLRDFEIDVGATRTGRFSVQDYGRRPEEMRIRFSRKLGTKAIDWTYNDW